MTEAKREIPKAYDPSNLPDGKAGTEDQWYTSWLDNELYSAKYILIDQKTQYHVLQGKGLFSYICSVFTPAG